MDADALQYRPKLAEDVMFLERDGVHIYFNPLLGGAWFSGPPSAGEVLRLCDGNRTVAEIARESESGPGSETGLSGGQWLATVGGLLELAYGKGFFGMDMPEEHEFPLNVLWLYVTRRCNLRCSYCYVAGGKPLENELTTGEICALLDEFKELGDDGPQLVALSGGEPLLRGDIFDILAHIKERGMRAIIATNGHFVTEENASMLRDLVDYVQVSLDGDREAHDGYRGKGSYDAAVRAVETLVNAGVSVELSATVTTENMGSMEQMVPLAKKYGLKGIKVSPLLPQGRADMELVTTADQMATVYRRIGERAEEEDYMVVVRGEGAPTPSRRLHFNRYPCAAGIDTVSVDADGLVYPCQGAHMPEFLEGDLRERSLTGIWSAPDAFKRWREADVDATEECSECMWRKSCGGGCRIHSYMTFGTTEVHDMFCTMYRHNFEEGIWEKERRLRETQGDGEGE